MSPHWWDCSKGVVTNPNDPTSVFQSPQWGDCSKETIEAGERVKQVFQSPQWGDYSKEKGSLSNIFYLIVR